MAGGFEDFIPADKDNSAYANGFQDFAPVKQPVAQELSKEEQLRLSRIANLAKAREAKAVKQEAK